MMLELKLKNLKHEKHEKHEKGRNSQPHVRPIVRGKVASNTEFGAKVAVSLVNRYAFVDKLSWDNFHEGIELKDCIENYYRRFGFYPEIIAADMLYRNRDNYKIYKQHGIHLNNLFPECPVSQRLSAVFSRTIMGEHIQFHVSYTVLL